MLVNKEGGVTASRDPFGKPHFLGVSSWKSQVMLVNKEGGGITHIGISMASVVWDFHGVGYLEFPSPFFLLPLMFVFDPSAGCCIVMTLMIVTDG